MKGETSVILQQDIFETHIANDLKIDAGNKYQEGLRISMAARGVHDQEFSEMGCSALKVAAKETPKITYEQAILRHYGIQGVLLKESPNIFGGWDERFCILKQQRFVYKENAYPTSPNAGVLNFNLLSCQLVPYHQGNQNTYFKIIVINTQKQFIFKAKSADQTTEWGKKLNDAIKNSQGFGKNLSYLAHYPRFWRKDYESQNQFRRVAETGDVLLFRGKKRTSMMQRVITGDEFDHVAVVLQNSKGEVLLFEANGGFGVGVCPWNRFILKRWYQQYDLVVHRHLNVLRTEAFLEEVDNFVSDNMGKKYDFSIKEYLFNRNSTGQDERDVFFCSSLVAKLFKTLQFLDGEKSCTQYLPSWFSEKGFLNGNGKYGSAYLDVEKIIVFQNL